jgi:hypothetical protein
MRTMLMAMLLTIGAPAVALVATVGTVYVIEETYLEHEERERQVEHRLDVVERAVDAANHKIDQVAGAEGLDVGALLSGPVATTPGFQFTCTTTAQRIQPASGDTSYVGIWVWNGTSGAGASATPVFIGDSTVTTTTGMPLCSGNCPRSDQAYESRGEFCIVSSGTVTVTAQAAKL